MAGFSTHLVNVWTTEGLGSVPFYTMVDSLLWLPDGSGPGVPRPGVVLVHGWGRYPYDALAREVGPRLAEAGVVVLSVGMRRRGGEGQLGAVPDDDLRDIKVGLDALAQHGVQSAVLVGQDVGALSVARYAAQAGDNRVSGIALVDRVDDLHALLVDAVGAEQVQAWIELAVQTTYEFKSAFVRIDADIPMAGRPPLWIFQPAAPFLAWWTPQPRLRLPRVLEEVGVPVLSVAHDEVHELVGWALDTLPRPAGPARFELVETTTDGDVPLIGYLVEPASGGRTDAAVLVVHGLTTGPFSPMVKMFLPHYVDHGFTAVAMETRRSGARCIADSFPENDTADIDAFVELLLARGFAKVVLVGASLGSQAISRYVARRHHPAVVGCVHLAPTGDMPTDTAANVDPRELERVIAEATAAVAAGHGDRLLSYDLTEQGPSRFHATRRTFWRAESWLQWWGPDAPTMHDALLAEVDVPVLLLSGTADDYNDQARMDHLAAVAKRAPVVDQVWVAADHGLRGAEADATAAAVEWLERNGIVEAAPARPPRPLAPIAGRLLASHVHPTVEEHT